MKAKLTDELITALLEVMNIPKSGYIEASLREKLAPLNPKHYTEVMMNLMDNQDRYAKPLEKVATAIQKSLDRYCHPKTVDELLSLFKRAYRGRVITDECSNYLRGTKLAVSADGDKIIHLASGRVLDEGETIKVLDWCLQNPEKIGIDNNHELEVYVSPLGTCYGDIVDAPLIEAPKPMRLIADLAKQKVV